MSSGPRRGVHSLFSEWFMSPVNTTLWSGWPSGANLMKVATLKPRLKNHTRVGIFVTRTRTNYYSKTSNVKNRPRWGGVWGRNNLIQLGSLPIFIITSYPPSWSMKTVLLLGTKVTHMSKCVWLKQNFSVCFLGGFLLGLGEHRTAELIGNRDELTSPRVTLGQDLTPLLILIFIKAVTLIQNPSHSFGPA